MNDYSILINTCDKFEDCWNPFFKLWNLYWPDCKGKVYLNTEFKDYVYPGLDIIPVKGCVGKQYKGKYATWSQCLRWALERIDSDVILYMQEDYFLNDYVKNDIVEEYVKLMYDKPDLSCIQLTHHGIPSLSPTEYNHLHYSDPNYFSYLSCQASLWRKEIMMSLIRDHETAWNFEWWGSKRAKYMGLEFLTINHSWLKKEGVIIPYIATGIIGGRWYRPVVELFKDHQIEMDYSKRGFYEKKKPNVKKRIYIKYSIWKWRSISEVAILKVKSFYNRYFK